MTRILLDPEEMASVATRLQAAAGDLDAIAGPVHAACCGCGAPPALEATVADLDAEVRATLGEVGGGFRTAAQHLQADATAVAADASLESALAAAIGAWQASPPAPTGTWMDAWLGPRPVSNAPSGFATTDTWIAAMLSGNVDAGGGWTWDPAVEARWRERERAMVLDILGALRAGGPRGGIDIAMPGGPTLAQIQAQFNNLKPAGLISGGYVDALGQGYGGSAIDWAREAGYDTDDPNVRTYG